ncbi:hypothetical protein JAB5_00600 [Janthinobacterium sp. HH103]|uniref:Uncharacterized protein n=1 Tax=Janthinobacterium agaricidamnosum TaxID=55508 RepID=A0A3G2E2N1_9BURK|nr:MULTISPECIES: hypothetical protein [Janthinobacterium]AYM74538.1 hypothetical protein D9M09_00975 [Janthinobacterium agaricidamnosum]MCC7684254.1 hypothetical protein [Janthinobacterium sp. FW305-128]OEZ69751.1 hypothetical protein JAB2_11300 [Janthinobacterium sp. HH100]OEZ89422.1 hypothetical protein JAB5_00600 [Janthinobacterium sp. HH103]OEZ95229.1 hypothetical protein JAB9_34910 [Janthinobacterium sp. HH107]
MKKLLTFVLIVMLACLFLDKIGATDMHMQLNGDEIDGPLEWLFGLVFAGGGLLIAAIALVCGAVVTGVVLAGVGVVLIAVVALCVALALALSTPVLLPLLIPVAIVWLIVSRNRKQAQTRQHSL